MRMPIKLKISFMGLLMLNFVVSCNSENDLPMKEGLDRVVVYYRDFSTLSPISYSKDDLKKRSSIRLDISDEGAIKKISQAIEIPCVSADGVNEENIDVYFLVEGFAGRQEALSWKASQFHFNSSPGSRVCKLDRSNRDKIEDLVKSLSEAP